MNTLGVKRQKVGRTLGSKFVGGPLGLGHKMAIPVVKSIISGSVVPMIQGVVDGISNSGNSVHSQNMPTGIGKLEKRRKQ